MEAKKKEEDDLTVNHKRVRGRNARHCSLYQRSDFVNRFIVGIMLSLSFLYLGFFAKVYILPDMLTYVYSSPISIGPLCLMYGWELFREYAKDRDNWNKKNAYFNAQMVKHKLVKESGEHKKLRRKINCGLIPNFIIFTAWNAGFMYLFCAKLD